VPVLKGFLTIRSNPELNVHSEKSEVIRRHIVDRRPVRFVVRAGKLGVLVGMQVRLPRHC
jgi:hypothetical protein